MRNAGCAASLSCVDDFSHTARLVFRVCSLDEYGRSARRRCGGGCSHLRPEHGGIGIRPEISKRPSRGLGFSESRSLLSELPFRRDEASPAEKACTSPKAHGRERGTHCGCTMKAQGVAAPESKAIIVTPG